jgi:hypothetical protein
MQEHPHFIVEMAGQTTDPMVRITMEVWSNKERFVHWPCRKFLYWPGLVRHCDGRRKDCYSFSKEQREVLKAAGLETDGRNNGPAILAFRLAGGNRPQRSDVPRFGWSIHHIYEGRFPAPGRDKILHATRNGDHFTEAAGLVALHPVAEGLAGDCSYFAWLLRCEAFRLFGYDPDEIFQ